MSKWIDVEYLGNIRIDAKRYVDVLEALQKAEEALRELYAEVKAECPRILEEDMGGRPILDSDIKEALSLIESLGEKNG